MNRQQHMFMKVLQKTLNWELDQPVMLLQLRIQSNGLFSDFL
jgi:hypothetical protein